jgi:hypothetical protein
MAKPTVQEVIGRIGIFVAGPERANIKSENVRQTLSYNHKQLHLIAPAMMRDYYTTYENVALVVATGGDPSHLPLTATLLKNAKEITSVVYLGAEPASYDYRGGAEVFARKKTYYEDSLYDRSWFHTRGKSRILISQGTQITGETSLSVFFVKPVDTSTYDLGPASVYAPTADFDCPEEMIEFLVLTTAKDLLMEQGNKQEQVAALAGQVADQRAMITQIDTLKSQQLGALDMTNKDIR